jgi:hypothetical protein
MKATTEHILARGEGDRGFESGSLSSAESATNLVAAGGVARGWDSEFESALLQQTVSLSPAAAFEGREPRFSARVWAAGLATGSAETRQAFHCAPTGGNVSAGRNSSTAMPALNVGGSLNSDRAQAKPSTIR